MNDRLKRGQASRSAAVKAGLDYPVIDTGVHVNDYAPALEDYVQHYGGSKLVDALRKSQEAAFRRTARAAGIGTSRRRRSASTTAPCVRHGGHA